MDALKMHSRHAYGFANFTQQSSRPLKPVPRPIPSPKLTNPFLFHSLSSDRNDQEVYGDTNELSNSNEPIYGYVKASGLNPFSDEPESTRNQNLSNDLKQLPFPSLLTASMQYIQEAHQLSRAPINIPLVDSAASIRTKRQNIHEITQFKLKKLNTIKKRQDVGLKEINDFYQSGSNDIDLNSLQPHSSVGISALVQSLQDQKRKQETVALRLEQALNCLQALSQRFESEEHSGGSSNAFSSEDRERGHIGSYSRLQPRDMGQLVGLRSLSSREQVRVSEAKLLDALIAGCVPTLGIDGDNPTAHASSALGDRGRKPKVISAVPCFHSGEIISHEAAATGVGAIDEYNDDGTTHKSQQSGYSEHDVLRGLDQSIDTASNLPLASFANRGVRSQSLTNHGNPAGKSKNSTSALNSSASPSTSATKHAQQDRTKKSTSSTPRSLHTKSAGRMLMGLRPDDH